MFFKPNFDLYRFQDDVSSHLTIPRSPFVAVFRRGGKTLVYLCDRHRINRSFDMVDWVFDQSSLPRPDVFLVEKENDHPGNVGTCNDNSMFYAAARATERDIPVVFADLSEDQMLAVLAARFPGVNFSSRRLHQILKGGPIRSRGVDGEMDIDLNRYGRDKFMMENIAAALNQYDTVWGIFGAGHFRAQESMLTDMLGAPEYMDRIPNMRRDFGRMEIKPIKLIDFDMGDEK
ncbi:TraB/GumN family protein [bacterium]|nr:TraB/GumN family protein [bacterium]